MQAARGLIGLAGKLAARMQRAQDHLKRGFTRKFRMRINRDATAIVADHHRIIGQQFHFDPVGMARHRLVHGIVQHLGHQMMQGPFIRAANIHARAFADRLQSFQHLDGRGVIVVGSGPGQKVVWHGAARY